MAGGAGQQTHHFGIRRSKLLGCEGCVVALLGVMDHYARARAGGAVALAAGGKYYGSCPGGLVGAAGMHGVVGLERGEARGDVERGTDVAAFRFYADIDVARPGFPDLRDQGTYGIGLGLCDFTDNPHHRHALGRYGDGESKGYKQ